jgi:putative hydrolase of the HAD superfamily
MPLPPDIQAVCFDAVGTLLFPEPRAHLVYAAVGARHGSRHEAEAIRQRFAEAFAEQEDLDRAQGWRTSEEREYQRWQSIVGRVLDDVDDPAACFRALYEHFARPDAWRCAAGTEAILQELSRCGYRLALASNYDHRLRSVVAGKSELGALSQLIISSEAGWRKPAGGFFEAVCAALQLPVHRIFFIGDDRVNDLEGATQAGLPAALVTENALAATELQGFVQGLLR